MKEEPKTRQMEKAYHVLFRQISDHCVAHGIDQKTVLEALSKYEVSTSPEFVKGTWRAILHTLTGKTSTKDQTREDVKLVQQEFGKLWGEITGIPFDWPSIENIMLNNYDDQGNLKQ